MTETVDVPRAPSPDALDASVRLARIRRQMFARVEEPPRIAQYHVLRTVGSGANGLVFAAWDPSLDRVVAIKVLRDPWSPRAGEKLRAEAVALAKLRHPAVVSVFEVGEHQGQCFLAMEYVEGQTARAWMQAWREAPQRDLRGLVDVIVQVARGLAAAHQAGLVHRDVKPDNVMIDGDGRARLMDFGLARRGDEGGATHDAQGSSASGPDPSSSSRRAYGTPGYMAPEQLHGGEVGPAADQFALAAWLFEALVGRRVRQDRTLAGLAEAAEVVVPNTGGVPRRIRAILRRALATDPARRFPSVAQLADALEASVRPRRGGAFALTGVLFAGVAVATAASLREPARCTGAEARMDGLWDAAVAASLHDGFDEAFAAATWDVAAAELDAWRAAWIEAHREACTAAQLRGELSAVGMDRRMACLEDRRRHLAAWTELVARADVGARVLVEQGAAGLPAVAPCRRAEMVSGADVPAPADPLARGLAEAAALLAAGDPIASQDGATAVLAEAIAADDVAASTRAHLAIGLAAEALHLPTEAHRSLGTAYEAARRSGDGTVATEAAIALARVSSLGASRIDEGLWWSRLAELEAHDGEGVDLRIRRLLAAAAVSHAAGRVDAALAGAHEVEALLDDPELAPRAAALARLQLARLRTEGGDLAGGTAAAERAAAELAALLGADHPGNAPAHALLSQAARRRGDMVTARTHARDALALAEAAVGPRHVSLGAYLDALALATSDAGDDRGAAALVDRWLALAEPRPLDEVTAVHAWITRGQVLANSDPEGSLAAYREAHARARRVLGVRHRTTVQAAVAEGSTLANLGRFGEAEPLLREGLLVAATMLGDEHPDVRMIHHALALAYDAQARFDEGLEHHQRDLAITGDAYGDDSYPAAIVRVNVCNALVRLGRYEEALAACDRAAPVVAAEVGASAHVRADLHNGRGAALAELRRFDEAWPEFLVALDAWRQAAGPRSYEVSMVLLNLGIIAEQRGDCPTARRYFGETLALREALRGPDDPSLDRPRKGLARCAAP